MNRASAHLRAGSDRLAFTLVEVIAATALTAMLMVLLLTVMRSVQRSQRELADAQPTVSSARLEAILRNDLAQAIDIDVEDNRLEIQRGFGSLDPATASPTHLPVSVVYEAVPVMEQNVLRRVQRTPEAKGVSAEPMVELIAFGITSFKVQRDESRDRSGEDERDAPRSESDVAKNETVPLQIAIEWVDQSRDAFSMTYHAEAP